MNTNKLFLFMRRNRIEFQIFVCYTLLFIYVSAYFRLRKCIIIFTIKKKKLQKVGDLVKLNK